MEIKRRGQEHLWHMRKDWEGSHGSQEWKIVDWPLRNSWEQGIQGRFFNPCLIDTSEVVKYEFQDAWRNILMSGPPRKEYFFPISTCESSSSKLSLARTWSHEHPWANHSGQSNGSQVMDLDCGLLPPMQMGDVNSTMTTGTPRRIQVCLGR